MAWQLNESLPIHTQLAQEIMKRIVIGRYPPGERIPSVRELALEAKVNPNTMQKALAQLERQGVIFTQRTAGKYVTADKAQILALKKSLAKEMIGHFLREMDGLGFTQKETLEQIEKEGTQT